MRRFNERLRSLEYWIALLFVAVTYLFCALQDSENPNPFAFVAQLAAVAVAFWIARVRPQVVVTIWGVVLAAFVAVFIVESLGLRGHALDVTLSAASIVACLAAPAAIVSHRVKLAQPGRQNLLAVIVAYVMVGMTFTFAYNFLALISPDAIFNSDQGDTLRGQLFFSFTTLTTLGYGNLVPIGPIAETLAIAESITGQLFIVVAVASLFGPSALTHSSSEAPEPRRLTVRRGDPASESTGRR